MSLFDNASVFITPNGVKEGKLYSIKPTDGSGDLDVVRATTATRVNSEGIIESVDANIPRLDYTNGSCPSILVEPQRTNLFQFSEAFNNAYWSTSRIETPYIADTVSPDGTLNAYTLEISNGETNGGGVFKSGISVSGDNSFSVFAKKKTARYLVLADTGPINNAVYFDLENGNVATEYSAEGLMEDFGNGWYRCTMKYNLTSPFNKFIYLSNVDDTISGGVSGGDAIYLWGAQLEAGSYATSYIPTVASSVTRNADVISKTGISDLINSEEGVLYAEIKSFISQDTIEPNRYITLTNGTSNERVALLLGGNINQLRSIIYSSTQSINISFTTSLTDVKQFNKLAVKYKSGDYAFFLNGVKIDSSTITNAFSANTLNDLSFDVGGGTQQFRGNTKDVRVYNTALTDAELIALTTI